MPVYLIWGDEDFNIEERLKEFKKNILKDDVNPLNYKKITNPTFLTLNEALRSQGLMFGEIINVIYANKFFVPKRDDGGLDDSEITELEKSFKLLNEKNHVIFLCPTDGTRKPDARKKLYKLVQKYGKIEAYEKFKIYEGYKVLPVLKKMATNFGLEISSDVASKLFELSGVSLRVLNNQLEKLKLLAHPNKKVTLEMVEEISSGTENIFRLGDFLLKGDITNFLKECDKILQKQHYLEVLAYLQSIFSSLFKTKLYSDELNSFEISKITKQNEFIVRKNLSAVSNTDLNYLISIKKKLIEAEFMLKTGKMQDPMLAFETLFFEKRGAKIVK